MVSSERSLKVQATIWVAVRGGGGLPEGRTCRVTPEGRWVACHFGRFSIRVLLHHLKANSCHARKAEFARSRWRYINHSSAHKWTAVVNTYDD